MLKFEELNLQEEILKAVLDMGFTETTPIQSQAIPIALTGRDVIGQAQTGTGKTAAFSIPFLQIINSDPVVQVLILTPTRELCIQVEKEIRKLSKYLRLKSVAVYGGQEITRQIKDLKARPQIIVATPGRLMDHMNRKTIRLDHLKMVVLDEADEMLNMGFLEDIESILAACPEERQTMMFSATMKPEIKAIANKFMKEPELVKVKAQELTVPLIEQQYFEVAESEKFKLLCRLLDIHRPELAMIFGRTKRRVDELTEALQKVGYQAEGLHGDLTQRHRDMVMNKFRNGQISILVATDVAARGLDISGVSHVINFDLPQETDSYVHRIGRTGRAGKEGLALTFVEPREFPHLKNIEDAIKRKLTKTKLPTALDAKLHNAKLLQAEVVGAIEKGAVLNYQELANDLIQEYGSVDALAAVLEMLAGDQDKEHEITKIKLTAEKPLKVKRSPDRRGHGRGGKQGDSKFRGEGQKKQGGHGGHGHNKERGGKRDYHKKDYQKKDYQKKERPAKTAPQSGKKSYRGGHKSTEA